MNEADTSSPYKERVRQLRESRGLSHDEVAEALGINRAWYWDVESCDQEIEYTLELVQVARLAQVLGVSLRELLAPAAGSAPTAVITFDALADSLRPAIEREGLAAIEDKVGWGLGKFMADTTSAWDENIDFLKAICVHLGIDWLNAIPVTEAPAPAYNPETNATHSADDSRAGDGG